MANVVKKHSISSELAQKMGGSSSGESQKNLALPRNVAILDDGRAISRPLGRMDGAPILCIEMAQNKGVHSSVRLLHTRLFSTLSRATRRFLAGHPHALRALWRGVGEEGSPLKWTEKLSGRFGLSGAPTVPERRSDCARAALALVPRCRWPTE